jgi:hypothetical protein
MEGRGPAPGEASGDGRHPPRLEVVRVEHREGRLVSVVARGWQPVGREHPRERVLRMWRLMVEDGLAVVWVLDGSRSVPLAEVPGLVLDLALTLAQDALGHLEPRWEV